MGHWSLPSDSEDLGHPLVTGADPVQLGNRNADRLSVTVHEP
jgi:hypothetical protein